MKRRDFISQLTLASAAATLPSRLLSLPRPAAGALSPGAPRGRAEHCIFLWLGGGMSQIDTFDPKQRGSAAKRLAAHFNAGNTLLRLDRPADAVARFERAVHLRPDYAPAHSNLGLALAQVPGRLPESVVHFEAAVRLDPTFDLARRNLQQVRAHLGRGDGVR